MAERFDVIVVGLGALGSGTCWQLAQRGVRVLGVEQFELGHERGASHDTSRILRRSYHTAGYVTLAGEAYDDWAGLSADAADELVTVVGGLDLFPPDAAIPIGGYTSSMTAAGGPSFVLDSPQVPSPRPGGPPPDRGLPPRHGGGGRPLFGLGCRRGRQPLAAGTPPRRNRFPLPGGHGDRPCGPRHSRHAAGPTDPRAGPLH